LAHLNEEKRREKQQVVFSLQDVTYLSFSFMRAYLLHCLFYKELAVSDYDFYGVLNFPDAC
jgi:hypothetical protein